MIMHARVALLWALVSQGALGAVFAPVPKLDSASATFFRRGTTNIVAIQGDGLGSANEFHATGTGVRAVPLPPAPSAVSVEGTAGGISVQSSNPEKAGSIQFIVAADAVLGAHELRVAGPGGVSNPLVFQVSDIPEIVEPMQGKGWDDAPLVAMPTGISGKIGASSESDYFKFHAMAGEELLFDVQANRTGSPLDATLVLLDAKGTEVARSEDGNGLDPFLVFTPKAEGDFVVRLSDARYQGGGDYRYHLVAGPLPYVESLFPFGGQRGSTVDVKFMGHRLAGTDRLNLALAADAPLGRQDLRARTPMGSSNPIGFEVGDLPEIPESEPNDAADKANAVNGATVVNGRIEKPGDVDVFRFKSPADQKWVIEVSARRFGSPLDALLTLMDAKGAVLQRNDDAVGLDARIEFDAKKDVEYLVQLRDLTDRGGERFGYRLSFRMPDTTPDFSVKANAGRIRLHRGGWVAVRCDVARRNGFDGIVRVGTGGLPPGVSAIPLALGNGAEGGWLLLGATEDALGTNFPLRIGASAEAGGRAAMRDVAMNEAGWLTLLPPAPFSVDVAQASASVEQNATTMLDLAVTRRAGFDGEVKVMGEGVGGVNIATLVLPPGKSRGQLSLNAAYNAATGTRPLLVRAEAGVDGQTLVQPAPRAVDLTVRGIPLFATAMLPGSPFFRTDAVKLSAAALPTNSTSAANSTEFVVKVERRGFEGEVALALEGVPAGVTATVQPVAAKGREASIRLLATDKAEAGKEHDLVVVATYAHEDRTWRQKTQPVKLQILAAPTETAVVATNAVPVAKPTP